MPLPQARSVCTSCRTGWRYDAGVSTRTRASWLRLRRLIRKELLQLLRDRRSLTMLFISPVLQLLVYGYAITTEGSPPVDVVLDRDATSSPRVVVDALVATGVRGVYG